ncbi:MAG: 4-hydroxy-tetrahydrodipicolinate reductase [Myxococcales bacterium]|nr:4-hydroxy-tetrahydrodipicolinate reductase [Myxococcales bacterium]
MRIVVNGSRGKMGQTLVAFAEEHSELEVVGEVGSGGSLAATLARTAPDVVVDFSRPEARMATVRTILEGNAAAVIGTSGFTGGDHAQIRQWVSATGKGCFVAPNFLIGSVLMQTFAQLAARYFDSAEIVEYHHETKVDHPSATALRTAELMAEVRSDYNRATCDAVASLDGSRGAEFSGIRIHAVRMPGFVASQEVLFGGPGQRLSLRHDSLDRTSYMPGVLLAARYIVDRAEFVYGLERILSLGLEQR